MSEEETTDRDGKGRFKPGNQLRYGQGLPKDETRGKGNNRTFVTVTSCLQHLLSEEVPETHKFHKKYKGKKWAQALAERMLEYAMAKGNPQLIKEILDRNDGTVKQVHEVEAQSRTIIEFVVAQPPDPAQHKQNGENDKLNGLTKKGEE
jgi:hypothetical protein